MAQKPQVLLHIIHLNTPNSQRLKVLKHYIALEIYHRYITVKTLACFYHDNQTLPIRMPVLSLSPRPAARLKHHEARKTLISNGQMV